MDFDRFFRGFFNIPRRREEEQRDPFQDFFEQPECSECETWEDDQSEFFGSRFGSFGHGSLFTEASEMFKHFEEMFRNIGLAEFPSSGFGTQFPQIEEANPRDKMLKNPDFDDRMNRKRENFSIGSWIDSQKNLESKQDMDLDDRVAKDGLSGLLKEEIPEGPSENPPGRRTFSSFVSIRTFTTADGKTEERRTVRDERGNVDTLVRRSVGDATHSVVTKTQAGGRTEKREEFVNVDQNDPDSFEEKWRGSTSLRPSYSDIFRRLFGSHPPRD
ncbi:uncharacterized protein LOC111618162 [Centruroides sculpturatus]|uniref:uncharacterized protein LOC111618162 n=1 Tax=Centruroides sculpturatus TaxID=218467 RepID=UPI000C6CE382|nr:uncharacterized protein LOC111618162 [Centruroides sculpturatus]